MAGIFGSFRFGPMGCAPAILIYILMVAALLGMLYLPWSLLFHEQ